MRFGHKGKIFFIVLLGLLTADHLTKMLTFYNVDNEQFEYVISKVLWIEKYVNPKALGIILIANKDILTNTDYWNKLASMILIPLLFWVFTASRGIELRRYQRYLMGIFLITGYLIFLWLLQNALEGIYVNRFFVVAVVVIIGNFVLPMGLCIVRDNYFRTIILLATAGNWGNLISYFYFPYRIIDTFGFGLTNHVYNLADIYGYLAYFLFYLSPIYVFIISKRDKHTGNDVFKTSHSLCTKGWR